MVDLQGKSFKLQPIEKIYSLYVWNYVCQATGDKVGENLITETFDCYISFQIAEPYKKEKENAITVSHGRCLEIK